MNEEAPEVRKMYVADEERERERLADRPLDVIVGEASPSEYEGQRGFSIDAVDGLGFNTPWPDDAPAPVRGDRIRLYGQLGEETRGVSRLVLGANTPENGGSALVEYPIWYATQAEREQARKKWLADYKAKQESDFVKEKAALDAAYEALPRPLKRRIDRFRAEDPRFRVEGEAYEMAACAEAGRLYKRAMDPEFGKALKEHGVLVVRADREHITETKRKPEDGTIDWEDTPENRLVAFDAINSKVNGYNWQLMHELMPEMDEGHSGNTWGHAFVFARLLIRDGDEAAL